MVGIITYINMGKIKFIVVVPIVLLKLVIKVSAEEENLMRHLLIIV